MKLFNNKGGVLSVVLILFVDLLFFLNLYLENTKTQFDVYNSIITMEKQKKYEILLLYYFKDMINNDILLSDEIEYEDYYFRYTVDVDYNTYIIFVESNHKDFNYDFACEIDMDTLDVIFFEYMNGDEKS